MYSFDEIQGNTMIINNLQTAIARERISHAYIFAGQAGMGKKLLANSFAKTLQCEAGGTAPCCKCVSCLTYESHNHPDVFHVVATKTKSIGVEDVREQITKKMEIKPYQYPYKIFLIDHADTMTVAAQNALLKTIEEPASYGVFMLLAENVNSFLATILSRCVMFKLKPLVLADVERVLIHKGSLSPQQARLYAAYAQGNIGLGLTLAHDDEFITMRERMLNILNQKKKSMDMISIFAIAKELEPFKDRIQDALDIMYVWYRDLIVAKETENEAFLTQNDQKQIILKEASFYSLKSLFEKSDAVWEAKRQLRQYGNFQLTIEMMLLKIFGRSR